MEKMTCVQMWLRDLGIIHCVGDRVRITGGTNEGLIGTVIKFEANFTNEPYHVQLDGRDGFFCYAKRRLELVEEPDIKQGEVVEEDQPLATIKVYIVRYPTWPEVVDGTLDEE